MRRQPWWPHGGVRVRVDPPLSSIANRDLARERVLLLPAYVKFLSILPGGLRRPPTDAIDRRRDRRA